MKIIRCLSILFFSITLLSCSSSSTPEKVVDQFFKLIKAHKNEAALELVVMDGKTLNKDVKKKLLSLMESDFGEKSRNLAEWETYKLENTEVKEEGKLVHLTYKVTYKDKYENTQKFEVINIDGQWKINLEPLSMGM